MKIKNLIKKLILFFLILQFILFVYVKQKFSELERKNAKIEAELEAKINENNLLKIKLTTHQNQYKVKQLTEKHLNEYKPFKPNQIIEKQKI